MEQSSARPLITPSPPLAPPPPPLPMITYDKGLFSLPDDIICEIFSLLDGATLKSCSLTGKVLSRSAKPFLHRMLCLTCKAPSRKNKFEGLQILGERGLLQHTRHLSIVHFPYGKPLLPHSMEPYIQYLRTFTNLRTLRAVCLDTYGFIPRMEEYFGAWFGTLRSLDLVFPGGSHQQIICFACQFPNLRYPKITTYISDTHYIQNSRGLHFDIKISPPLDGTLDLQWDADRGFEYDPMGAHLILGDLVALPSGLKFRTLKIPSDCTSNNLRLLVNACAPTLKCMVFIGGRSSASFLHGERPPFTSAHTI